MFCSSPGSICGRGVLRRQPLPLSLLASHPIDISRN